MLSEYAPVGTLRGPCARMTRTNREELPSFLLLFKACLRTGSGRPAVKSVWSAKTDGVREGVRIPSAGRGG